MSTAGERSPSAAQLESRLEFEMLIADTSASLFASPPEQLHAAVEHALGRVRVFFRADRCSLLWVSDDQQVVNVRLASYADGVPPLPRDVNVAPLFPWSRVRLLVEHNPVRVSSVADLPPDADAERHIWTQLPIRSALTLPIKIGGVISHLICLNTVHQEVEWPDAFMTRLRVLGEMLVEALVRQAMLDGLGDAEKRATRAADRLLASEARLASAVELAGLGFYEGHLAEGVMYVDDRFCELCAIPADRRQGLEAQKVFLAHVHPDDLQRLMDMRELLHGGPQDRLSIQYRYLHPARGEMWIEHEARVASRDAMGRAATTFGVIREITQRKQAEQELRDLSRRLIRAHEEERALLARELHDDVTQRLAVLAIDAGRAELAAPEQSATPTLRAIREELVRLSEDVHSLAYHLHPSVLSELGLIEALRAECERRARQNRIEIAMDFDELHGLGKEAALCLFRVAQEALTNIVRHAGSATARVTLRMMSGGLLLAVSDNGIGFDVERLGEAGRLGLASMRERVRLVNGTLDIETAPGRGTTVVAWVPTSGGAS